MHNYFLGKLSVINYNMAIHEGNANRRLASQTAKLLILSRSEVPVIYLDQFDELMTLIDKTVSRVPAGLTPIKLGTIQNRTAVKYIKLLMEIEDFLKERETS